MPDAYRISAPGRENGLELGLRVPEGDTVSIGNISYARSETTFTVLNLAVNTTPFTIDGVTYGAGRGITFDLQVSTAISSRTAHIDFSYTTAGGIQRTDRLHLLIYDAVAVEASSEIAGASVLGQTGLADNLLAVVGTSAVDTNLGDLGGETIPPNSDIVEALVALESKADLVDAAVEDISEHQTLLGRPDGSTHMGSYTQRDAAFPTLAPNLNMYQTFQSLVTSFERLGGIDATKYGCDPTGSADSAPGLVAAVQAANVFATNNGTLMRPETTGSSISRRGVPKVILPPGNYKWDSPCGLSYADCNVILIEAWGAVLYQGPNFPTGRWMIEAGLPGSMGGSPNYTTYGAPFRVNIEGLTLRDYDRGMQLGVAANNINLGRMALRECVFIGKDGGASRALRVFNRSADFVSSDCQWDNNRECAEFQSIDRIYIDRPRVQIRDYQAAAARALFEGMFTLRRGHMYLDKGTFNPPQTMPESVAAKPVGWLMAQDYPAWVTGTAYAFADMVFADAGAGTKLWVCKTPHTAAASFASDVANWAEVDQTGSGPLSVWGDVMVRKTLFGGEGGGLVPCIWDLAAHDANPGYPRGVSIRDSTCNTNTQCGYELMEYNAGLFVNSSPIVLVSKIPNKIEVRDIKGGLTYMVAADFLKDSTPPTLWVPTQTKPFQAIAENIEGTTFHNYSPSGGLLYKYSPTWMPQLLAVPTLQVNDVSPYWPANAKVAKTANTSATTISLFYGLNERQEFTLYINDANTTIADGTYIKLNGSGSFTPGANGGAIRFVVFNGAAWEVGRSDHA